MQRARSWRKATGFIAATGLVLVACGGGSSKLSGDDLAGELDGLCRTATRAIDKLDPEDGADYYTDAADLLETAGEDIGKLSADDGSAGDVEDFVSLIEDEVKALQDVADAADSGDATALAAAQADLAETSAEADELAGDLEADRCVGIGVAALSGATITPTVTTVTETTVAETTTTVAETTTTSTIPPTTVPITLPQTVPPTLPPPPVTTLPEVPTGSITTGNMMDTWIAPPGFTFDQDASDVWAGVIFAPEGVASIAPFIVAYEGGAMYSDDGSLYAMGALELTSDFTDGQISDWIDYESAGNGEVQTTPGGLSVWYEPPAADSTYALYLWILGKYGMYVTLDVGIDGLPFVDAFTTANFE